MIIFKNKFRPYATSADVIRNREMFGNGMQVALSEAKKEVMHENLALFFEMLEPLLKDKYPDNHKQIEDLLGFLIEELSR